MKNLEVLDKTFYNFHNKPPVLLTPYKTEKQIEEINGGSSN